MKVVIQRVNKAHVTVDSKIISSIGKGLCVLVGISQDDTIEDIKYIVKKILNTRIFENTTSGKKWDTNVVNNNYEILCISQFTLCHQFKGNKLTFHHAMDTHNSKQFYNNFLDELKKQYKPDKIFDGIFGAYMNVCIENDGPVTIVFESSIAKSNTSETNTTNSTNIK